MNYQVGDSIITCPGCRDMGDHWPLCPKSHEYIPKPVDKDIEEWNKVDTRWYPKLGPIRTFDSGATRDVDDSKLDYEGFLSPIVLKRFAEYMHKNRIQPDGSLRASDNWQKGIPKDAYMKSLYRHFHEVWHGHREGKVSDDALCAVMFNVMGYLFENLKGR